MPHQGSTVEGQDRHSRKELRGGTITVNGYPPGPTATKIFLDGKQQEGNRGYPRLRRGTSRTEPQD